MKKVLENSRPICRAGQFPAGPSVTEPVRGARTRQSNSFGFVKEAKRLPIAESRFISRVSWQKSVEITELQSKRKQLRAQDLKGDWRRSAPFGQFLSKFQVDSAPPMLASIELRRSITGPRPGFKTGRRSALWRFMHLFQGGNSWRLDDEDGAIRSADDLLGNAPMQEPL